jgi:chromodomain-helicase-DNA-binding protein 7
MGLGKTIQCVAFLSHLFSTCRLRGPYLVIAPLSTLQHWKKTIEEWTMLNGVVYHDHGGSAGREMCYEYEAFYTDIMKKGTTSKKSKLIKFHLMVTSYEVFMQDYEKVFSELPW